MIRGTAVADCEVFPCPVAMSSAQPIARQPAPALSHAYLLVRGDVLLSDPADRLRD